MFLRTDLTIESSLKTCEEVWLGKVFEILPHTRGMSRVPSAALDAASDMTGGSDTMAHALLQTHEGASKYLCHLSNVIIFNLLSTQDQAFVKV